MTFQKGQSGNPLGRPRGARNKLTLLAESMFEGDAAALVGKLIEVPPSWRWRTFGQRLTEREIRSWS